MVNAKDLRDMFDDIAKEATKRASSALRDADIRPKDHSFLFFCCGLALGAAAGLIAAFLATPYSGVQAREKIAEQVDKVRRQREEDEIVVGANGGSTYSIPTVGERPVG